MKTLSDTDIYRCLSNIGRSFGCLLFHAFNILVDRQRHGKEGLFLDAPNGLEDDHGDDEEEHS